MGHLDHSLGKKKVSLKIIVPLIYNGLVTRKFGNGKKQPKLLNKCNWVQRIVSV